MSLKKFEEYVKLGFVKKQTPNNERAESLVQESEEKYRFLQVAIKNIPDKQMNANFIVESCYDILMELIRAKMFIDGFNSKNSHEAEISYMDKINFSEGEMRFMDELRYNRNGIKYYGKRLDADYAEKVSKFMKSVYPKLNELLNKK